MGNYFGAVFWPFVVVTWHLLKSGTLEEHKKHPKLRSMQTHTTSIILFVEGNYLGWSYSP
jgi:hypothetical protein